MTVTIENVVAEWKVDSVINDTEIQRELFKTPNIHAKYLDFFVFFKKALVQSEKVYNKTAYLRKRYYRGELTKDELDKYKWDQYQGLKVSSSEFNQLMAIDPILVSLKEIVESNKAAIATCEYIMKSIMSRDYLLKSAIDYQKWISG